MWERNPENLALAPGKEASAQTVKESMLLLISMALVKVVEDPEDQTGDAALSEDGASRGSFARHLEGVRCRVRRWSCETYDAEKDEGGGRRGGCPWGGALGRPPAGTTWKPGQELPVGEAARRPARRLPRFVNVH